MFCVTNLEPPHTFSFKVTDAEFDELSGSEGFIPAPYLARAKWVFVTDSSKLSRKDLKNYLQQSYDLIKAKLQKTKERFWYRIGLTFLNLSCQNSILPIFATPKSNQ